MTSKGKKGKTIGLMDFLADPSTQGSWADSEIYHNLPSAPASVGLRVDQLPTRPGSYRASGSLSTGAAANNFKPIDMDKIPTQPPFTAFVGNLPFDVEENDLHALFSSETDSIIQTKLIKDREGKSKGFGYVEFKTQDALRRALERQGSLSIKGRAVRIDLSDNPSGSGAPERGSFRRESRPSKVWGDSTSSPSLPDSFRRSADIPPFSRKDSEYREGRNLDRSREPSHPELVADKQEQWRRSTDMASSGEITQGSNDSPRNGNEYRHNRERPQKKGGLDPTHNVSTWRRSDSTLSDADKSSVNTTERQVSSKEAQRSSWR
jgi:translation initiation factor 4B